MVFENVFCCHFVSCFQKICTGTCFHCFLYKFMKTGKKQYDIFGIRIKNRKWNLETFPETKHILMFFYFTFKVIMDEVNRQQLLISSNILFGMARGWWWDTTPFWHSESWLVKFYFIVASNKMVCIYYIVYLKFENTCFCR